MDSISIPATGSYPLDVFALLQISDDPLDSAFGDPDAIRNVSQSDLGIASDEK